MEWKYRPQKKPIAKTIRNVVKQALCTGCGTCTAVCPKDALTLMERSEKGVYHPRLDNNKCDQCGICLMTCPGVGVDFKKLNLRIFGKEPEGAFIGNYLNCYAGYATDPKIRYKSASGGLVTALLSFALEEKMVDGALVTRMSSNKPLKPRPFIARTKAEVVSAATSKYCPVPANVALKEILEKEGRYIVVGLPCHIQGVRKAEILNRKLRDRVSYCFGLVCNHTPSFNATKYLLKKLRISEHMVAKLDYRGKGWPGGMNIMLNDGSKVFIPSSSPYYWGMVFERFFWPSRCMVCEDKLCELADITFMDAWLPEFSSDRIGTSLIVVRSQKGKALIKNAMDRGVVKLQEIPAKKIIKAMSMQTVIAKVAARRLILQLLFNKVCPSYKSSPYSKSSTAPTYANLLDALHFTLVTALCERASGFSQFVIDYHVALWNVRELLSHLHQ